MTARRPARGRARHVVDDQRDETAAGVVLEEGLGEHPGMRQVVT